METSASRQSIRTRLSHARADRGHTSWQSSTRLPVQAARTFRAQLSAVDTARPTSIADSAEGTPPPCTTTTCMLSELPNGYTTSVCCAAETQTRYTVTDRPTTLRECKTAVSFENGMQPQPRSGLGLDHSQRRMRLSYPYPSSLRMAFSASSFRTKFTKAKPRFPPRSRS